MASCCSRRSSRRTPMRKGAVAKLTAGLAVGTDHDVLEHRQPREEGQVLERPGDPQPGDAVGRHVQDLLVR